MTTASATPRVVVTGPTGWIGHAVVDHLAHRFGRGWRANVSLFASSDRMWTAPDGSPAHLRDLRRITSDDVDGALVVHLAHPGRERVDDLGPRAFSERGAEIDALVLSALGGGSARAVFVASSGAAAQAEARRDDHPYAQAKLRQEAHHLALAQRSATPLLVGRIWSVAGPWINKVEHYALGSFLTQATSTGVVAVRARGPVLRSYLHVDDLSALVVDALLAGTAAEGPVDLCGESVVEVGELATVAASVVGAATGRAVRVDRGPMTGPEQRYAGDPAVTGELAASSGRSLADLHQQVTDTEAWLRTRGSPHRTAVTAAAPHAV